MPRRFRKLPLVLALIPVLHGTAALAQEAAQPVATDDTKLDAVTVFTRRQTRQIQELGRADVTAAVPGTSPLKLLDKLPGVNFQSADTYGAYEWSTKLTVRGFNQNQMGFTLDDVPLGDMSYRNSNGLHISRAISSENIGRVVLSQGAGALDTASNSNLGGTVQFYSLDPAVTRRVTLEQTVGQNSARRTFARFDSGELAPGTRLALSVTDQGSEKWKGSGDQRQRQVNAKLVSDFGANRLSAFVNYSDRQEVDYQDLSKALIQRLGYRWDNYYPNWNAALQSAQGNWSRGETSIDDAYYAGAGLRTDWLAGVTLDSQLSDNVSLKTTAYHHDDDGTTLWFTPYRASPGGTPVSLRTVSYGISRNGILSTLSVNAGSHSLKGGFWYEDNNFKNAMRFYAQDGGPSDLYRTPSASDLFATRWAYEFKTRTLQFHLQDSIQLSDKLKVNVGFKSPSTETSVSTTAGNPLSGSIKASKGFLPQLGANYVIDARNEVFAGLSRNIRAYKVSPLEDSPFATTQAGFDAIKDSLKPETSTTLEAGWRHRGDGIETSLTAYHVEFKNRLLAIQQGAAIAGNPSVLGNVGKVSTNGIEAGLVWSPLRNLQWFNSLSYNDSKYKDDFYDNGSLVAVSGKQVVDSPKLIAKSQLGYDNGATFGRIGVNYLDKRYYSYLNDASVSAYSVWDLSIGHRFKRVAAFDEIRVQAGVNNLFDKQYVASIGTNGFVTSDAAGTYQTLLPGAPRTVFATVGARF
ncbi:MAG: TonB-dependent receptor [Proteobacteria bacterium]|nr:TonB-dependent receptor [Pseudomonadota bacterium]